MKKILISLTVITIFFSMFPAYGAMQIIQFDKSIIVSPDQIGITINNDPVGNYTLANYQNTLFIDDNFFKYYFGVTEEEIKNNVAYGGTVDSGNSQILCVPFLPILSAMGLQYTTSNVVGKNLIAITVPVNNSGQSQQSDSNQNNSQNSSDQPENITYNTYNTTPADSGGVYYYPVGLGLATGVLIGETLNDSYYTTNVFRGFDVDHCYVTPYANWTHATLYNGSVYHAGTTGWNNNVLVHTGTTVGDNGWVNHTGVTWKGADGNINHIGNTKINGGGGFHRGRW